MHVLPSAFVLLHSILFRSESGSPFNKNPGSQFEKLLLPVEPAYVLFPRAPPLAQVICVQHVLVVQLAAPHGVDPRIELFIRILPVPNAVQEEG